MGNFEEIAGTKDGSEVPDWLEYDPVTGQIIAENPPENVDQLELN